MENFTAHRLMITTEVRSPILLNEHQGSAIRGAIFHALRRKFCAFARDPQVQCGTCALAVTCPVAILVSTLDPESTRGQDIPRPYTIQPPLPGSGEPRQRPDGGIDFAYPAGARLAFGLTLYAQAMQLFPYVVLAVRELEAGGLGQKVAGNGWQRGKFAVQSIQAENPLTREIHPVVQQGTARVQVPDVPITHAQVGDWARRLGARGALRLRFLTPVRLVDNSQLLKSNDFAFRPFFQRLIERLESLSGHFSDTPLKLDVPSLLAAAESVRTIEQTLRWEEVRSYSTRRHGESPIGGLIGSVVLECDDWTPFQPWLAWGAFAQVGKDAVKGNGWYTVEAVSGNRAIETAAPNVIS